MESKWYPSSTVVTRITCHASHISSGCYWRNRDCHGRKVSEANQSIALAMLSRFLQVLMRNIRTRNNEHHNRTRDFEVCSIAAETFLAKAFLRSQRSFVTASNSVIELVGATLDNAGEGFTAFNSINEVHLSKRTWPLEVGKIRSWICCENRSLNQPLIVKKRI